MADFALVNSPKLISQKYHEISTLCVANSQNFSASQNLREMDILPVRVLGTE